MIVGGIIVALLLVQLYMISSQVLQKRRHLRAFDEVKDM